MKIFLGNPPWAKGDRLGVRAGSRWPFTMEVQKGTHIPGYLPFPFYLAYAAAVLEKNDIDVLLVDAIAEGIDNGEFLDRISNYNPNLVLLETSTPSIYIDLAMAKEIKERIGVQIALCGPHVSVLGKDILEANSFVDYILIGEYEYTLLDLVKHLDKKGELREVLGLICRDAKGEIQTNHRRPPIENLDKLPWPARHFLPMHNYADLFCGLPAPNLQMWASRGCPYKCIFCMWPEVMYGGHRYYVRNPVDIVNEMEWCIREYGFKSVYFDDDTFNIGKERILKICEEIKKRGMNIPWAIMARADTIDREMLRAMRDAELYALKYGVESGDQEILDNSGKNLDLEKVEETIRITKELGIKVHLTFMFGLPGETKETIKKTINFALKMDPDSIQFSLCTPFPGTKYFKIAEKKGFLLTKDWADYDGADKAVIRTEALTKEGLENALSQAHKTWSSHLLKRNFRKNMWRYLGKGLRHPIKGMKRVIKILFHLGNYQTIMPDAIRRVEVIDKWLAKEEGLFLDLGCGDCRVERRLSNKNIKFIGVDFNLESLKIAKEKGNNVICANAKSLPFKNGVFNGSISTEVFEHIKNDKKVIKELNRVLKKDSTCIVTVPNKECKRVLPFKNLVETMYQESKKKFGHVRRGYTLLEINDAFESRSFEVIDYRYDLKLFGAFSTLFYYWLLTHEGKRIFHMVLALFSRAARPLAMIYSIDDYIPKKGFTIFAKYKKIENSHGL